MKRSQLVVLALGTIATYLLGGGLSFPERPEAFLIAIPLVTVGFMAILDGSLNRKQKVASGVGLVGIAVITMLAFVWSFELGVKGDGKAYCPDVPKLVGPPIVATALILVAVLALKDRQRPS